MNNEMLMIATVFVVALVGWRIFKTIRLFIGGAVSLYGLFMLLHYILR